MNHYQKTEDVIWSGRTSNNKLYLHEKIKCIDLASEKIPPKTTTHSFALLGYACDEGVERNKGRIGAASAPNEIRKMLASLANHFDTNVSIYDLGNITCVNKNLEETQKITSTTIAQIITKNHFCIAIGGGHDLAYAHYNGIKKQVGTATIGIINLDAHFDLRVKTSQGNSGTPFNQIANENTDFKYLCLGIQRASNNKELYAIADHLGVQYIENTDFRIENLLQISTTLDNFIASVDHVYLTIDMDGFSSAYAPGVSAPSPFGFSIDIVMQVLKEIYYSKKLISTDIVELNPKYDLDNCTARLAARLVYNMVMLLSK